MWISNKKATTTNSLEEENIKMVASRPGKQARSTAKRGMTTFFWRGFTAPGRQHRAAQIAILSRPWATWMKRWVIKSTVTFFSATWWCTGCGARPTAGSRADNTHKPGSCGASRAGPQGQARTTSFLQNKTHPLHSKSENKQTNNRYRKLQKKLQLKK